jgi:APA family basic amino acid/polyamine antiporter
MSGNFLSGHFSRKPLSLILEESKEGHESLRRTLSATNLTLLGVGGIIGAGIFVLTGQAAAQYAGPAIILSFIFSGIACAFAALCYAELAAMIPIAGSAYTYAFATMGRLAAWVIGWDLILEYLFGASAVSVGWSGYMVSFLKDFGIIVPKALTIAPYEVSVATGQWISTGGIINLPAVVINILMTVVLVIGIRESANFNNIIVLLKCGVLILFIGFGLNYVSMENMTPFIPENTGDFGHYGWSGIFRGAGVIFFAYIGFDGVSTLAQESKNPQRDMPIGIIGSLVISTIFYVLVAFVMTGLVHYSKLNVADPIAVAVDEVGPALFWLRPIIKMGAIAGLSSVVLVMLMSQPRIFFSMAKDGFLPPIFAKVHPKYQTPHITTIICGVVAAVIAGFVPIAVLGELVSIGTLLAFVLVCLGVLILRKVDPNAERPFRTPYVVPVSILGALTAFAQMVCLPGDTWIRLLIWMGAGMIVYWFYGRKHSIIQ